jgi:hypothetical protein
VNKIFVQISVHAPEHREQMAGKPLPERCLESVQGFVHALKALNGVLFTRSTPVGGEQREHVNNAAGRIP